MRREIDLIVEAHVGTVDGVAAFIVTVMEDKKDGGYFIEFAPYPQMDLSDPDNMPGFIPGISYRTPTAGWCNYAELAFDYCTPPDMMRLISRIARMLFFMELSVVSATWANFYKKEAINA